MANVRHPFLKLLSALLVVTIAVGESNITAKSRASVGEKTCMRVLGCFEITPDFFHLTKRPFNFLPQHRAIINTQFFLFTRSNVREKHILDAEKKETITSSLFDPTVPTKIIIHGFIDNKFFGKWQVDMKDELLLTGYRNVILVDWSGGNGLPYTQAAANARVVGAEIAFLIKTLQETVGLKPKDCHILGHSLGSHVAGYAGERVPGLGRITGLDPAEPYFQDLPPSVRLDETDAEFVDVIHTDSRTILLLGLGMSQACGHVDFYPNGGKSQPGCTEERITSFITDGLVEGFRRFVACNHQRAVDFYHQSVTLIRCVPVAYECRSWENFLEAKCTECGPDGSNCAILGEKAIESKGLKQKNKKLYLKTSSKGPYCLYHYKVLIKLYKGKTSTKAKGTLQLKFFGVDFNDVVSKLTPSAINLYPGSTYTYLITTTTDLAKLKTVYFSWKSTTDIWDPASWLKSSKLNIDFIKIIPMNIIDQKEKMRNVKTFCPTDRETEIKSGKETAFKNTKC